MAVEPNRKLSRAVLLACPVLFTGFVGLYSRNYDDMHTVPSGTEVQDQVAFAYIPYIQGTKQVFGLTSEPKSRTAMLALANKWDKASQKGELQPLLPVSFEDSPEEGARSAIMRAKGTLVSGLLDDATELAHQGKALESAREALLATRVTESLKYSDFTTVNVGNTEEDRALALLKKVSPNLDAAGKAEVRNGLTAITANSQDLAVLTRFSRIQYYDYLERVNKSPVSIEDVHKTVLVTKRITSDPRSAEALNYARMSLLQTPEDDGPEYLSDLRLAWGSQTESQKHIKAFLSTL
jgi:hypothetical protein